MSDDSIHLERKALTVNITGGLSHHSWDQFRPLLQKILMGEVIEIQLDFNGLAHLDSAGLSLLGLLTHSLRSKEGTLRCINVPPPFQEELTSYQLFRGKKS